MPDYPLDGGKELLQSILGSQDGHGEVERARSLSSTFSYACERLTPIQELSSKGIIVERRIQAEILELHLDVAASPHTEDVVPDTGTLP